MTTRILFLIAALALSAGGASASEMPQRTSSHANIFGGSPGLNKAAGDTILLMGPTGSGAPYIGDFEDGMNGWTSLDITQPTVSHWQVSDYAQAVAGNLAAWCGDLSIPTCNDSLDIDGGYGNSWHDILAFRAAVADPGISASVTITATLQNDTEGGYDFTYLSAKLQGQTGYADLQAWDGKAVHAVSNGITYLPAELIDGTDVMMLFRFESDGGWSDEDCSWPTAGACQIDDITVTVSQAGLPDIVSFTDFQDGTFGDWDPDFPTGVGDFAQRWFGLEDLDPCATNYTAQVAFIDNGIVVPGTGGADCVTWCYGPGGYIVNTIGGLAGPDSHIENHIWSPVMTWPNAGYDGLLYDFSVYRHETLSAVSPGIFYIWSIRSADTDGSAGGPPQVIENQPWEDRNFVFFGGPDYLRVSNLVTDLVEQGRDQLQVRLGVYELGWVWGFRGNDGTPAPYFDNVALRVFPTVGPAISSREIDLAQDNFPEADAINPGDLGALHVRFDMARNISLASHLLNDPGDSIYADVVPVRSGAALLGAPRIHYIIDANPLFDPYRSTPTSGSVAGMPAVGANGFPIADRWAFDLPDTGTLFPGDVLHYYIRAEEDLVGDVTVNTLPADLAGFGDFSDPLAYNSTFTVRALPSLTDDFGALEAPPVLFWNDFANRGGQNEWHGALRNIGLEAGVDFDIYYTNGPSSGVGNGIGGRTNGLALDYYDHMLYTAGDLSTSTLSNGDFNNDAGDDIGALLNWLSTGNRNLFVTGDDVVSDLAYNAGASGQSFSEDIMGVSFVNSHLRDLIGNQTSPLVLPLPGNPVFQTVDSWIAFGGCFGINSFDAVTARAGAVQLAEFGDTNGNPGAYSFSAATYNLHNGSNRIISLPYDLMYVYTDPNAKIAAPLPGRARILKDVFDFFAYAWPYLPTPVPEASRLAVGNAPNPFNPVTKISYTIKAPGHLSLKVYDVRGQLVRTLIDGRVESEGFANWDGTDDGGRSVASGVYFTEARMGNDVQVGKMALVK